MISFNEFKEKVMFGYMAYEDKLYVTMYFDKFSKYLEVQLNVFVHPGQRINMPSEKLRESISDKIYYWYEELKGSGKTDCNDSRRGADSADLVYMRFHRDAPDPSECNGNAGRGGADKL